MNLSFDLYEKWNEIHKSCAHDSLDNILYYYYYDIIMILLLLLLFIIFLVRDGREE
jgi:hypothetical protein